MRNIIISNLEKLCRVVGGSWAKENLPENTAASNTRQFETSSIDNRLDEPQKLKVET